MKNAPSGTGKPRIPLPKNPEVEVVWSGSTVSKWGERGSLLPPTHNVGSTWDASVARIQRRIDAINKDHLEP
jgi:hypothetical protein